MSKTKNGRSSHFIKSNNSNDYNNCYNIVIIWRNTGNWKHRLPYTNTCFICCTVLDKLSSLRIIAFDVFLTLDKMLILWLWFQDSNMDQHARDAGRFSCCLCLFVRMSKIKNTMWDSTRNSSRLWRLFSFVCMRVGNRCTYRFMEIVSVKGRVQISI